MYCINQTKAYDGCKYFRPRDGCCENLCIAELEAAAELGRSFAKWLVENSDYFVVDGDNYLGFTKKLTEIAK